MRQLPPIDTGWGIPNRPFLQSYFRGCFPSPSADNLARKVSHRIDICQWSARLLAVWYNRRSAPTVRLEGWSVISDST